MELKVIGRGGLDWNQMVQYKCSPGLHKSGEFPDQLLKWDPAPWS